LGTGGYNRVIDQLAALHASVARLDAIVGGFDADGIRAQAYPTEWSVADVLGHLGSAAVISEARLDAALAGNELADDFQQDVWDEWNAKSPDAKAADGLRVDRAFLDQMESLADADRARVKYPLGPMTVDFALHVQLRLNEHALHTWDIEVVLDPNATLPTDAAGLIVDQLGMLAQWAGKPTGIEHDVQVHTVDPTRDFTIALGAERVALTPYEPTVSNRDVPNLVIPAEAFVRLVYGRLDPAHTPPVRGDADLDELRRAFPGV
jgi:uncharacterized protein (TIGR03083 family)